MNNLLPIDHDILMHRDAHFHSNFQTMIDYYKKNGKGVHDDFDLERIVFLRDLEEESRQNLSPLILEEEEKDRVEESLKLYELLKALTHKKVKNAEALIADLILSESDNPEEVKAALLQLKGAAVKPLIEVIRTENYYDPLFPGYGKAPQLATEILGAIGDRRAIIALFEEINQSDFFNDEVVLKALYSIGKPAEDFLLGVLKGKPYNLDNEKAAQALHLFKTDKVASICFEVLKDLDLKTHELLASYLILNLEGLENTPYEKEFIELSKSDKISKTLKTDFQTIIRSWQKKG